VARTAGHRREMACLPGTVSENDRPQVGAVFEVSLACQGTRLANVHVMNIRLLSLTLMLGTLSIASGCIIDTGGDDATLTVFNDSSFVIEELYLAPVGTRSYGPNELCFPEDVRGDICPDPDDALFPDESITLGVDCDFYDALVIDEDGVECEVFDLDLCLNDAEWVIRNNTCTVFEAAARERAAKAAQDAKAAPAATEAVLPTI
jgi:hypothetical protein